MARVDLETSKIDFTLASNTKRDALQTNAGAAAGDAHKNKLGINKSNAIKDSKSTDFKPLSTRALDRAKKDRTGTKKMGKAASKSGTKSSIKSSPKSRDRNTKNKGKR